MRGQAIRHDDHEIRDPLLRAIADLRDQVDRLIVEQKVALGNALIVLEEEPPVVEKSAAESAGVALAPAAGDPPPKARRPSAPAAFERIDEPSPTPPRPVSTAPAEPPPPGRPDDSRERLDALAKHLDRKLRQAGGPSVDPAARPPE